MKIAVEFTVPEGTDAVALADWLLDLLCKQDPTEVPYASCDGTEPTPWPTGEVDRQKLSAEAQ